jgi:hypothetical protein
MPGQSSVEEPQSGLPPLQLVSRLKADPRNEDARSMTKLHVREVLKKKAESDAEQERKKIMKDFGQVLDGLQEDWEHLAKSKNPIVFGSKLIGMVMNTFQKGDPEEKKSNGQPGSKGDGGELSKESTMSKLELKGAATFHDVRDFLRIRLVIDVVTDN